MIAPHLEEMDKTMDDVVFLKVDVDECEDIAEEYKVDDAGHDLASIIITLIPYFSSTSERNFTFFV